MNDKYDIVFTKGGGTANGYWALKEKGKKVFHCPMKEMLAIKYNENDIVADIGAYTGQFASIVLEKGVKLVKCYEPTKYTFDILKKYNNEKMQINNLAVVGNDDLERKFFISKGIGVTNSLFKKKGQDKYEVVKCINYNDAIKDCSIVKIDIEGGEYEIPNLIQDHIRAYLIDFHKVGKDWQDKANKIVLELEEKGYICKVKPNFNCGWTQAGAWIKQE
jgi:FkbM family methyltransferase